MTQKRRTSDPIIETLVKDVGEIKVALLGDIENKKKSIFGRLDLNEAALKRIYVYMSILTAVIVYAIKS